MHFLKPKPHHRVAMALHPALNSILSQNDYSSVSFKFTGKFGTLWKSLECNKKL